MVLMKMMMFKGVCPVLAFCFLFFFSLSLLVSRVVGVVVSCFLVVLNMSNKKIENEKGLQKSTISKKRIIEKKKTKKKKKHIF